MRRGDRTTQRTYFRLKHGNILFVSSLPETLFILFFFLLVFSGIFGETTPWLQKEKDEAAIFVQVHVGQEQWAAYKCPIVVPESSG